jgi:hypothetical protein
MNAVGQTTPFSDANEYNTLDFIIQRALDDLQTVSIAQIMAVNSGAQTVDVKVLVNLVTGAGTAINHGVISARPFFRLQGGSNAIICDPAVGDIGVVVFGSRDLTAVIAAKGQANPGSNRRFAWSDAIYYGGVLNQTPTQYIKFVTDGINIVSPSVTVSADMNVNGTLLGETLQAGNGATGEFTTADGKTVTVVKGVITSIA